MIRDKDQASTIPVQGLLVHHFPRASTPGVAWGPAGRLTSHGVLDTHLAFSAMLGSDFDH
jgi:hypothetical protein